MFNALLALYDEPPGRKTASRADRQQRSSAAEQASEKREPENATLPPPAPDEVVVADAPAPSAEIAEPSPEAPEPGSPPADEVPSEVIARDIIAAGFVEETAYTASATDDTGVNPALSETVEQDIAQPDPAATDVSIENAAAPPMPEVVEPVQVPMPADTEFSPDAEAPAAALPEAANEELIEDLPAANDPFIADMDAAANDPQIPGAAHHDEAAPEASTIIASAPLAAAAPEPPPEAEPIADPVAAEAEAEGIDLSAPDEDFGTVRVIVPAAVAAEAAAPDANSDDPPAADPATDVEPLFQPRAVRSLDTEQELELLESPAPAAPEAVEAELTAPAPPPRRTALWAAGAALCALLIGIQLVHANRTALAQNPSVGPTVSALYARLGMPIAPHWDVRAYDVRQQGAVGAADATAPLTVRASIVNRASREQPLPLLRVTLQDRFGNRIALRDLQPREYLPAAAVGKSGTKTPANLAPGQRIDAEVAMADPGGKAVGFEIDACLQVAPGRFLCANDQAIDHGPTSAAR